MLGPVANDISYVPIWLTFLTSKIYFLLESVGQSAGNHKVLNCFITLITIGTLRRTNEAFFDQVVPSKTSFVAEQPEKSGNLWPCTRNPN